MSGKTIIGLLSAALLLSALTAPASALPVSVTTSPGTDLKVSPSPAVYLDSDGTLFGLPGIRIDDPNSHEEDSLEHGQFFDATFPNWLQVVALNRSTLQPIYAKNYSCPQVEGQTRYDAGEKAAAPCIAAVQKDFTDNRLDERALVIATNHGQLGNEQAPYGVIKALKPIGVKPVWWWGKDATLTPGTFSAVGVPGSAPGQAHQASGNPGGADEAAIRTVLARNNLGMYEVLASDRIPFVTDAPASSATTHVMRINDQRVAHAIDGGGYHVAWMARGAASPAAVRVEDDFFATQKGGRAEVQRMLERINAIAGSDTLGFVVSVGQPRPNDFDYLTSVAVADLVDALQYLGGTRNAAFGPLDKATAKGQSYTLIGHGQDQLGIEQTHVSTAAKTRALGEVRGPRIRAARPLREGQNNAGLAGMLTRDHTWRYAPTVVFDGDTDAEPGPAAVVYSPPTLWPGEDDGGKTRALAAVGDAANLGSDPRGQYWTRAYDTDYWNNRLTDVQQAKYSPQPGVTQEDFQWAQDQLVQEIRWVKETYGYYRTLSRPYESAGFGTWAKMATISGSIDRNVAVADAVKLTNNIMSITRASLELLGEFPKVGEVVSATMAVFDLAAEITELVVGEPLESDYATKVSELGEKTADRLQEATETVSTMFPRIVVSDYAKLKTVGQCAGSSKACEDRNDWQVTPEGLKETGEQFKDSMSVMFYQSLLPAKYNAYELNAAPMRTARDAICPVDFNTAINGWKIWRDASPLVSTPVRRYASHADQGLYNVIALGSPKNDRKNFNEVSYPTDAALKPLFGTGKDQLGVDRELFIRQSWDRLLSATDKFDCRWDKNAAVGRNAPPTDAPPKGGVLRKVRARIKNDTGHTIWIATYFRDSDRRVWAPLQQGAYAYADSATFDSVEMRVGVMFEDPAYTSQNWQDELRFVNPLIDAPYIWHVRSDVNAWSLSELSARGSSGWKDQSYQVNGYPYNLWMQRNGDDPYYKYFDVAFSLRPASPLDKPGPPPDWPKG